MQLENSAKRAYNRGSVERVCEACGVRFFTTPGKVAKGKGRWCSKPCRGIALRTRVDKQCLVCGTPISVKPSQIAKGGGKFCASRKCRDEGLRKLVVRTCLYCHKDFEVLTYIRKVYCTKAHALAARKGIPRTAEAKRHMSEATAGVPRLTRRLPLVEFTCLGCGETRMVDGFWRQMVVRGHRRFCTTACWYEYLRVHPEESGTFRGGRMPYYGPNWREQARQARMRDNFTCQDCGATPKLRLDVHHIVPRRTFHEDFLAANALDNLVSLCKRCHRLREVEFDGMFCPDLRPGAPGYVRRGEASPHAHLTESDVRAIRAEYTGLWGQQSKLAQRYGVTPGEIAHIVKGRAWKHSL